MKDIKEIPKDKYGRREVTIFGIKHLSNGKPKGAPFRWDGNYQTAPHFYRNMVIELAIAIVVSVIIGFVLIPTLRFFELI